MLMLGNFIIGTGILLPAGLLNDFTADFNITASRAGMLLFIGGLVVGIGAPTLAALTSRIERRPLLVAALCLYAAGHAAAALAPSFELQLILRGITVIGAAVFTPQAASTVGLLVPADKRAGGHCLYLHWLVGGIGGGYPAGVIVVACFWMAGSLRIDGRAFAACRSLCLADAQAQTVCDTLEPCRVEGNPIISAAVAGV
jgi:MFS transporter, DHA1 family, inner membrane transport protein